MPRVVGRVTYADVCETPAFVRNNDVKKMPAWFGRGLRYERKVHEKYQDGEYNYVPNLWFKYTDASRSYKHCSPDALVFDVSAGLVTIVEIKYQISAELRQIGRAHV